VRAPAPPFVPVHVHVPVRSRARPFPFPFPFAPRKRQFPFPCPSVPCSCSCSSVSVIVLVRAVDFASMLRIGVDLGGTKIEGVALDADGAVRGRRRVPTPRHDYRGTIGAIARIVGDLEQEAGARGSVGVGIPGAISPATGLVKNANSVWLNGRPFPGDLEARLQRPVRFANDANCFALSEATDGAGAGARVVFGVILGTGTGGGLVVDGRVLTGPNAIAGEWGHNPMPWPEEDESPGAACYCGRRGCIETFLSGPGLGHDHRQRTGEDLPPEVIVACAAAGNRACEETLARYESRMARALASVINVVDPDVIVLGGGLSRLARLYANVPPRWASFVFSDRVDTRLEAPRHGDASGVRGAAWLWAPGEG
jgi:fructokinase